MAGPTVSRAARVDPADVTKLEQGTGSPVKKNSAKGRKSITREKRPGQLTLVGWTISGATGTRTKRISYRNMRPTTTVVAAMSTTR